jgi:FtsH-binding integral membrane protein
MMKTGNSDWARIYYIVSIGLAVTTVIAANMEAPTSKVIGSGIGAIVFVVQGLGYHISANLKDK